MAVQKKKLQPTALETIPVEARTPIQQLGVSIQQERPDLEPSVRRILESDLSDDGRLLALQLFEASLHATDDPHRDPRAAIAACR